MQTVMLADLAAEAFKYIRCKCMMRIMSMQLISWSKLQDPTLWVRICWIWPDLQLCNRLFHMHWAS